GTVFGRIWDQAGLPRSAGGQQPRPYDFRHHFAYACIERWMKQRKDVAAMLPYLSRYMGHATRPPGPRGCGVMTDPGFGWPCRALVFGCGCRAVGAHEVSSPLTSSAAAGAGYFRLRT